MALTTSELRGYTFYPVTADKFSTFGGNGGSAVLSGNEVTDAQRLSNTDGDGWPFDPSTLIAGGEVNLASTSAYPWSGWEGLSGAVANQLSFGTSSPTPRQGTYWVKYTVRPGDKFGASTGERSEHRLDSADGAVECDNQEHWYAWSTQFPAGFVRPSGWCIFTQFHADSRYDQSAFKFQIDNDTGSDMISLVLTCGPFSSAGQALSPVEANNHRFSNLVPISLGLWHDFIFRVRYSSTGNGIVQLWHRLETDTSFSLIVDSTGLTTIPVTNGDSSITTLNVKQGMYRNDDAVNTISVYHDGMHRCSSYAEALYSFTAQSKRATVGIWQGATNLIPQGSFESNSTGWANQGAGAHLSRVTGHSQFGVQALQVLMDGAASSESAQRQHTLTNGQRYVYSDSVEIPVAGQRVRIWVTDSTSTTLATTTVTGTGARQRIAVPFTANANNPHNLRIGRTATGSSQTIYVDGAQLETGPSETPYIHTDGSTASRNASRVQVPSTLFTATEGWFAIDFRMGWRSDTGFGSGTGTPRAFEWTLDSNNYLRVYYDEATQAWKFERKASGSSSVVSYAAAHTKQQRVFVMAAWTATQIKLSVNGLPFTTATNTNIPSGMPATLDIGSDGSTNHINADVAWFTLGKGQPGDDVADYLDGFNSSTPPEYFVIDLPELTSTTSTKGTLTPV